ELANATLHIEAYALQGDMASVLQGLAAVHQGLRAMLRAGAEDRARQAARRKGGRAYAQNQAGKLVQRDEKIRARGVELLKAGMKPHIINKKISKECGLPADRVRKIRKGTPRK